MLALFQTTYNVKGNKAFYKNSKKK